MKQQRHTQTCEDFEKIQLKLYYLDSMCRDTAANVEATSQMGSTPLHVAAERCLLGVHRWHAAGRLSRRQRTVSYTHLTLPTSV